MESVFSPSVLCVPPVACLRLGGPQTGNAASQAHGFRGALCSQEPVDDGVALGGPGSVSCLAHWPLHARAGRERAAGAGDPNASGQESGSGRQDEASGRALLTSQLSLGRS